MSSMGLGICSISIASRASKVALLGRALWSSRLAVELHAPGLFFS
jgi:hypothetical protein